MGGTFAIDQLRRERLSWIWLTRVATVATRHFDGQDCGHRATKRLGATVYTMKILNSKLSPTGCYYSISLWITEYFCPYSCQLTIMHHFASCCPHKVWAQPTCMIKGFSNDNAPKQESNKFGPHKIASIERVTVFSLKKNKLCYLQFSCDES